MTKWSDSSQRLVHQSMAATDVLSVLWRRRRIVQVAIVLGVAVAVSLRAHKATEYTASALVMISPGNLNLITSGQAVAQGLVVDQTTIETQLQIVRSPDHIDRVMASLHLFDKSSMAPSLAASTEVAAAGPSSAAALAAQWWDAVRSAWPWLGAGATAEGEMPAALESHEPPLDGLPSGGRAGDTPAPARIAAAGPSSAAALVAQWWDAIRSAWPWLGAGATAGGGGMSAALEGHEPPLDGLPGGGRAGDTPAPARIAAARQAAIAAFTLFYAVNQVGRSSVIMISFTSPDPERAARVANAAADLYVQGQQQDKLATLQHVSEFLGSRLIKLRDQVESAERAVVTYKRQNGMVEAQGTSLTDQDLANLSRELIVAKLDLGSKEAKYEQARQLGEQRAALDSISDVIQNPLIVDLREQETALNREDATLRATYGERHPKVLALRAERSRLEARIGLEVDRIVASLRNDLNVTSQRVATIQIQLDLLAAKNSKRHDMTIQLNQLEREAETSRQLYELFLQRFNETREQENVISADAKVISRAMPPTDPITPGMLSYTLVGLVASAVAGSLLALLRDHMNTSMLSGADVERVLQLPTVALVPRLRARERPHTHLLSDSFSPYSDAISTAHAALAARWDGAPARSMLITSSVPEEGKTTLAVSLACFAAMSGLRTLLIDADLRRPGVAAKLNAPPSPGLADHLSEGMPLSGLVVTEPQAGFDYIPTGRLRRNPAVFLSSQRMRDVVRWASTRYDLVLVDAPPLLGVPDASITAAMVDQVVFVSRWKTCNSATILNALKQLGEARAKIVGVVLTQVNVGKYAHYGYTEGSFQYGRYKYKPSPLAERVTAALPHVGGSVR